MTLPGVVAVAITTDFLLVPGLLGLRHTFSGSGSDVRQGGNGYDSRQRAAHPRLCYAMREKVSRSW